MNFTACVFRGSCFERVIHPFYKSACISVTQLIGSGSMFRKVLMRSEILSRQAASANFCSGHLKSFTLVSAISLVI